jgi:hypothetical protein
LLASTACDPVSQASADRRAVLPRTATRQRHSYFIP